MSRRALLFVTLLLVVVGALGVLVAPRTSEATVSASEAALQNALTGILDGGGTPNALWGVYVQNLRTGEVVMRRNADRGLLPASTIKLVTTAAALSNLGADFRYETGLYHNGRVEEGTLRGDLILRGSGDPTFGSSLESGDPLVAWARELHAMGVRRVEGRIIGDARAMQTDPYGPGWDVDYIANASYAQSTGGLSYRDNLVAVQIAGTSAGRPAEVTTIPSGYVNLIGEVGTRSGRGFSPLRVDRRLGTNDIDISGNVSPTYRGTVFLPIHDPTAFTMRAFAGALERAGITVEASLVDARDLDNAPSYDSDPLFVYLSPPLEDILGTINRRSNNFYSEQVLRTMTGSARGGIGRVMAMMQSANASTSGFSMRDGSGLSRKNLVPPETMGRMLAHIYADESLREPYLRTLARGGQPGTTLRFRLGGVPVWAKTGTIEHVRGFAGYTVGPDRTPYAFVFVANNFTVSPGEVANVQDRLTTAIAQGGR